MEVLLGHEIGAPGRHAAGAVVDGAEDLGAGRIGIGLQPRMAGGGAGDLHRGLGGDAAVLGAVADHLPLAVDLADLDDAAAMGGHFDGDAIGIGVRHHDLALLDRDDAREHQVLVGVFVVDHEQAVLGRAVDRDVAHEVVVVAELARLRLRGLVQRVELGRVGEDRVAPAQEHVGVVAFGHVVIGVDAGRHLGEAELRARGRVLGPGPPGLEQGHGANRRGDRRGGHRAFQDGPAREARSDDFAHGGGVGRIEAGTPGSLQLTGAEMHAWRVIAHRRPFAGTSTLGESVWLRPD